MFSIAGGILIAFWAFMLIGQILNDISDLIQRSNWFLEDWFDKHVYRNRNRQE